MSIIKPLVLFGFLLAILWVWKSNEADKLSRRLTQLEREKKTLIDHNKLLHVKLEKHRSIAWIDSCVRQNYKMTYDVKKRIVLFDKPALKPGVNQSLMAGLGNFFVRTYRSLIGKN